MSDQQPLVVVHLKALAEVVDSGPYTHARFCELAHFGKRQAACRVLEFRKRAWIAGKKPQIQLTELGRSVIAGQASVGPTPGSRPMLPDAVPHPADVRDCMEAAPEQLRALVDVWCSAWGPSLIAEIAEEQQDNLPPRAGAARPSARTLLALNEVEPKLARSALHLLMLSWGEGFLRSCLEEREPAPKQPPPAKATPTRSKPPPPRAPLVASLSAGARCDQPHFRVFDRDGKPIGERGDMLAARKLVQQRPDAASIVRIADNKIVFERELP